jgi:hypothetical protein
MYKYTSELRADELGIGHFSIYEWDNVESK